MGVASGDTAPLALAADALERALGDSDGRVDPTEGALAAALTAAAERLATATLTIDTKSDPTAAGQATQLAAARLDALRRLQAPAAGEVAWTEGSVLHLAPVSVAERLRELLFAHVPVVLLSATLGTGARFAPFTRRLGLDPDAELGPIPSPDREDAGDDPDAQDDESPGFGYVSLQVESPFDFREQAVLYVARHLPEPRDAAWPDAAATEICELVAASGGRALVLCTSRAAVTRVSERLRAETDHPILVQGESTKAMLLTRFAEEEASCLVATRSFWMGVDIPGPSCVLVVIDRLPFGRPDDPLLQARREAAERNGGSGFQDVDLPAAALVLAQGVGRLIRTKQDRGVVAILDRRLATAGYRNVLLDALPPMRRVVDPAVVRDALEAIVAPPQ